MEAIFLWRERESSFAPGHLALKGEHVKHLLPNYSKCHSVNWNAGKTWHGSNQLIRSQQIETHATIPICKCINTSLSFSFIYDRVHNIFKLLKDSPRWIMRSVSTWSKALCIKKWASHTILFRTAFKFGRRVGFTHRSKMLKPPIARFPAIKLDL